MRRESKTPDRIKEVVRSNTCEIRAELGLTQKELGQFLGVTDRAIQNYEALEPRYSLPIEKAMLIHNKWNYSLDQIYLDFYQKPAFNKFNVDIRDFVSIAGESIVFSIPDYYWEYLKETKTINESDFLPHEKKRGIKSLEAEYLANSKSVVCKCEIPISEFFTMIRFGKEEIPYVNEENSGTEFANPTEEQIKEADDFLKEITRGDHG
ncbi:MAG: helix-turn-helix transcriptional regulator [Ruminococcaceae bacterium]|nr:helix-turn-helix transcriptional regulator [Oscillospiraceae bacterium]